MNIFLKKRLFLAIFLTSSFCVWPCHAQMQPSILHITPNPANPESRITITGKNFGLNNSDTNYNYDADLNKDGTIGIQDFVLFKQGGYGSVAGDVEYNPDTDINKDGTVDISDFVLLKQSYGSSSGASYVEFHSSHGTPIRGRIIRWSEETIECEIPKLAVSGNIHVTSELGESIGVFLKIGTAKTAIETAVSALITFAGSDGDFENPDSLTDEQRLALQSSLIFLNSTKFMIFNHDVIELPDNDDSVSIDIIQNENIFMLDVTQDGISKGHIKIADLSYMDKLPEPLNPDEVNWHSYLYNLLDIYARQDPQNGAHIGENESLLTQIKTFLNEKFSDIGGLETNFTIIAEDNSITIMPQENGNLEGVDNTILVFDADPMRYDKNTVKDAVNAFSKEITNAQADEVFIIDEDHVEKIYVSQLNDIVENPQATSAHTEIEEEGMAAPSAENFLLAEPSSVYPKTCSTKFPSCDYADQTGRASVIPCNTQIDYINIMKDSVNGDQSVFPWVRWALLGDLETLEDLGYHVREIDDDGNATNSLEKIVNSESQIIEIVSHGTLYGGSALPYQQNMLNGFIGPFECIKDDETGESRRKKIEELNNTADQCLFKEYPLREKTDYLFIKGHACGDDDNDYADEVGLFIKLERTTIGPKAIETGTPCWGILGIIDILHASYLNPITVTGDLETRYDLQLLFKYLKGIGPNIDHYKEYPPELNVSHNINVMNADDWSLFSSDTPMACVDAQKTDPDQCDMTWFEGCYRNINGVDVQIPCRNMPQEHLSDVHLFPYVQNVEYVYQDRLKNGIPIGQYLKVTFSDTLKFMPDVKFTLKGENVLFDGEVYQEKEWWGDDLIAPWEYWFMIKDDYEVLSEGAWNSLSTEEKQRETIMGEVTIQGAYAKANGIELVGNPLAEQTEGYVITDGLFTNDYAEFFLYDQYFWNYNARGSGSDFHTFKAQIPIFARKPYIKRIEATDDMDGIDIVFSEKIDPSSVCNKIEVEIPEACQANFFSDKPFFNNSESIPHFVMNSDGTTSNRIRFKPRANLWSDDGSAWALSEDAEWPLAYTVKVRLHDIKSAAPQSIELLGNEELDDTLKWFDSDITKDTVNSAEEELLYLEENETGDFEFYVPCLPPEGACVVVDELETHRWVTNVTKNQCNKEHIQNGKEFHFYDGNVAYGRNSYLEGIHYPSGFDERVMDYYGGAEEASDSASRYGHAPSKWNYKRTIRASTIGNTDNTEGICTKKLRGVENNCPAEALNCILNEQAPEIMTHPNDPLSLEFYQFSTDYAEFSGDVEAMAGFSPDFPLTEFKIASASSSNRNVPGEDTIFSEDGACWENPRTGERICPELVGDIDMDWDSMTASAQMTYVAPATYTREETECSYEVEIELNGRKCDEFEYFNLNLNKCCGVHTKEVDGNCVPVSSEDMFSSCSE